MWPEKDPSTIDEMVEVLSAVEGINVHRSKENPAVVHIIDERLVRLWALFLLTYSQGRQAFECFPTVEACFLNPP
jgi:hypothetical protein